MSIEQLLREGIIHPFQATPDEIHKALELARRDLDTAMEIVAHSPDWSYNIAYNSVLQACKAYMFYKGYRPALSESHKATFAFMQDAVSDKWHSTVSYFDRVRKKRHRVVYDEVGLVSEKELGTLLEEAGKFLNYLEHIIMKESPE